MNRIMKTMDGNTAASHVAYAYTDVAAIFPITPSSPMGEKADEWASQGRKNIFGQEVKVVEMQSEAGAAGAVHGSLQGGALTTTFTASQGLLLMVPNMYKISGELLPGVFHVSARALAAQALSIFGDHQDVMATRQTGFALLASNSVQQAMDLAAVTHIGAIKGKVPFLHFFDGFRTSHELQKVEVWDYDQLAELASDCMDDIKAFRKKSLNPEHPVTRGTAQNPDIYFQAREACNPYYDRLPELVEETMNKVNAMIGTDYKLFNYYGAQDADRVIIAMGSVCETIEETVDHLVAKGEKIGLLSVHLYRPFSIKHFLGQMPKTVKKIAVLDRTKEPGSTGEPLYLDIRDAYYNEENRPVIVGGRFGLGSKDTTPAQIVAVYDYLNADSLKTGFTVGINDDLTNTSIPVGEAIDVASESTKACQFWGLGSDGTVGANKSAIKIIGDKTDMYAQGYFSYDSKKSGGITVSHLRFGKEKIKSTYLINKADYVACHNQAYVNKYNVLKGIKDNGIFLLNTLWNAEELESKLPTKMKKYIAEHGIKFYTLNALKIAQEVGLGGRINMIMQSAFFKLANIIPMEDAAKYLKEAVVTSYSKKGQKIVDMNFDAIDKGAESIVEVNIPESWNNITVEEAEVDKDRWDFMVEIADVMNAQEGDTLPVSAFAEKADGTFPQGTSAYEKRGIGVNVPEWLSDNCIQCNQCSYVCPHAVIRPFLVNDEEVKNAPEGMKVLDTKGKAFEEFKYSMGVSVLDCTGCGNCADICPAPNKALVMKPLATQEVEQERYEFLVNLPEKQNPMKKTTVKGSQFEKPLFEFSGACAGCGETPYAKLITQLFGDRMIIANATGCSSIWGGSAPATPYTTNDKGHGPAWANSLFEDNAEYGYGMYLAVAQMRDRLQILADEAQNSDLSEALKATLIEWKENFKDGEKGKEIRDRLLPLLEAEKSNPIVEEILEKQEYLVKKSVWVFGGDGWAYDIGYGGVDHVLASGDDINIFVMDTEVYSNTGGQSSKATPTAAIAKFAAGGKRTKKKDLGMMAMSYGYVYVSQISMGADKNQTIKAITEAENYDGPSLVIAYAPCINHGIKKGMGTTQDEMKRAVDCGYWALYRFNPTLKNEGKNPFSLDSKEPKGDFQEFIKGEVRYAALEKIKPEIAQELFNKVEADAKERLENYKKLANQ
ncbi:pyruvate:ferredoxin (flavodoxin) oxidoreductase [Oceanirhabdus seepicola]|uniref:Pyruvate:ferredoxin oxidoreductase n=1 Tax=Oceanirhabdus seepicola TaxID=2828781 RepID=A0A9J6NUJ6_9CLOT|nr:pyruvate:ferredoxin (flavodoxin) oxidoreductase [Oceanirhabdus seepicola]MCM1988130.1 pyruvate:ferredoxin (flavodoxin) oxidoreductase [Oceanirhabdus seepicola]